MQIPVILDNRLRVDGNLLGHDIVNEILDELVPMDGEGPALADLDGDTLVMPRGYAMELKLLLRERGHSVWWVDRRTWKRGKPWGIEEFSYRRHQPEAVRKLIKHQQGIYEAPTGSGKTTVGCAILWELCPANALILVEKKELLHQWRNTLLNDFGADPDDVGIIGEGKWIEKRFTVATVQTLYRRAREGKIGKSWFKKWKVLYVDECHHTPAETYLELVMEFWARLMLGFSATPDPGDDRFDLSLDVLGDVILAESEEELRADGVIIKPTVFRVTTGFTFRYWGNHKSDKYGNCQVPTCKRTDQHSHKDNYQQLKTALVRSKARNAKIASVVLTQAKTGPHHHLMISDEVRHLDEIESALTGMSMGAINKGCPPIFRLQGKGMTPKQRAAALEGFKAAPDAILLSTVAKEGLDVPAIDRTYLPFPGKRTGAVEQKIGRGTRAFNGKVDSLIFDFVDYDVIPLRKHFKQRVYNVYMPLGLEVVF